jgi:hypothetical protein
MPWFRPLLPGIAILLTAACAAGNAAAPAGASSPTAAAPATPAIASEAPGTGNAPWALNLDLGGDLTGHVGGTAPSDDSTHNDCTGADSARLGSWGSTMAFTVGGVRYALFMLVKDYRGAGVFTSGTSIEVASEDQAKIWQNESGDPVTFTVGANQESGLLEAELSNVADTSRKLTIAGHWSCSP